MIDLDSPLAKLVPAYTSGTFNIGVAETDREKQSYSYGYGPGAEVYRGTRDQAMARLRAAQSCAGDINAANQRYVLGGTGSVSVDSQNPGQRLPGFNSNGGAASLLQCMGANPSDPNITNASPGAGNPVLTPSQVRENIDNINSGLPPDVQIPRPPEQRGDLTNGSVPFGFGGGLLSPAISPNPEPSTMSGNGILSGVQLGPDEGADAAESPWAQAVREMWARRMSADPNAPE
ncbi:MAG TPA: hypothetical protein VII40_16540 [Xanthobacteraceae bacterium]